MGSDHLQGQEFTDQDLAELCRQLAAGVEAADGLRILAFELAAGTTDQPAIRALILALRDEVSSGRSLAAACRSLPAVFDAVFCDALAEGEQMGKAGLTATLRQIEVYLNRQED
ncbi:MAG: type II secretion system F family protein [Proteobacteria bacterium]|jgi:type IV pilus assembly protein PilC|nr:type II secretion system F family protein [Pseudomonadota bacterium]MDA1300071.1 type II secretion system F family protein [Pseudomonadota bacterium]